MIYLPPEIWFMIINNLDDQASLSKLCRVSKTLHEIATPRRYGSPCTRYDNRPYTRQDFFRTLIESPHLAKLVIRLPAGFDRIFIRWGDLTQAVEDVFNRHCKALLRSKYLLPEDEEATRDDIDNFLEAVVSIDNCIPLAFCRTVLVSLLPNLSEMRLSEPNDHLLASIQPGALPKLKKIVFEEDHELEFGNLEYLARAAPNLDSLSFFSTSFTFQPPWKEDWETPWFPAITNLNLEGLYFTDLETSVIALVLNFPVLQSFRFYGQETLDRPSLPKIASLLRALRDHAPQLKHLCLEGAYSHESGAPPLTSEWSRTLKIISSFSSLETFSIDDYSLFPFDGIYRRSTLLADCLPQSLLHLHLELFEGWGETPIRLVNTQSNIRTLARAISQEGQFSCLKMVSFSLAYTHEDLAEPLKAMEEAGVPMVRQRSPWGRDELYDCNWAA